LTIIVYYYITSFIYLDHLRGIYYFGLPVVCPDMPVTTQSKMKRGLQPHSGSAGLLTCPTCCTDGNIINNTDKFLPLDSSSQVPELVNQCDVSSSSSEADDSSSLSCVDSFQISNFENFEFLTNASDVFQTHNFEVSQSTSRMASNCNDSKMTSVKNDTGQDTQKDIMKMLSIISNQMMGTIQDLQVQLTQTESKFTSDIQHLSAENERFRQTVLADVQNSISPVNHTIAAKKFFSVYCSQCAIIVWFDCSLFVLLILRIFKTK